MQVGVTIGIKKGKEHLGYFVFVAHNGTRYSKLIGEEKAARRAAADLREKLARDDLGLAPPSLTLAHYFNDWLETQVKPFRKPATYANYRDAYRRWIAPLLGSRPLGAIRRRDVQGLIKVLVNAKLRPNTIRAIMRPLITVLLHAKDEGLITQNPVSRILPSASLSELAPAAKPMTREQVQALLMTCRQHKPVWYPFLLTLARTGLRIGEAKALRWDDLDFVHGCLWVRRSYTRGQLVETKSRRQRRVDMSTQLKRTLEALRPAGARDTDFCFLTRAGTLVDTSNFHRTVWRPLLRLAHLPHFRVHDLRHTFATHLIDGGESLVYVRDQLGHASIKVTADIYTHLTPGANRRAVDLLDDLTDEPAPGV